MDNRNIIHRYNIHRSVRHIGRNIEKNEYKDRVFEVLNDTDNLPIHDLVVDDENNMVNVYLTDGIRFSVHVENCGIWCICRV